MEVPPHATLAARTAAALHTLQQSFHLSQARSFFCADTFLKTSSNCRAGLLNKSWRGLEQPLAMQKACLGMIWLSVFSPT